MPQHHWIFDWIDVAGIESRQDAHRAIEKSRALKEIERCASNYAGPPRVEPQASTIVAGSSVDLGDTFVCDSPQCREGQIAELLRRAWHYFDYVVVDDPFPRILNASGATKRQRREALLHHIHDFLYLKELGADSLVIPVPKPPITTEHLAAHQSETGISEIFAKKEEIITDLQRTGRFYYDQKGSRKAFWFENSTIGATTGFTDDDTPDFFKLSEDERRAKLLEVVFQEHLRCLVSDVCTSRQFQAPLGSIIPLHGRMLQEGRPPSRNDVAFHLTLPVLADVPLDFLVRLRTDQRDHFDRFRNRLREAIDEKLKSGQGAKAEKVAEEIQLEMIEPELQKIKVALKAANSSFAKKAAWGASVGTVAATCGLLFNVPPAAIFTAAAAAVVAGVVPGASRRVDEVAQATMSDVYILWEASRHAHHG